MNNSRSTPLGMIYAEPKDSNKKGSPSHQDAPRGTKGLPW